MVCYEQISFSINGFIHWNKLLTGPPFCLEQWPLGNSACTDKDGRWATQRLKTKQEWGAAAVVVKEEVTVSWDKWTPLKTWILSDPFLLQCSSSSVPTCFIYVEKARLVESVCTCSFECISWDFQIPALLYETLALESFAHSFSNFP